MWGFQYELFLLGCLQWVVCSKITSHSFPEYDTVKSKMRSLLKYKVFKLCYTIIYCLQNPWIDYNNVRVKSHYLAHFWLVPSSCWGWWYSNTLMYQVYLTTWTQEDWVLKFIFHIYLSLICNCEGLDKAQAQKRCSNVRVMCFTSWHVRFWTNF